MCCANAITLLQQRIKLFYRHRVDIFRMDENACLAAWAVFVVVVVALAISSLLVSGDDQKSRRWTSDSTRPRSSPGRFFRSSPLSKSLEQGVVSFFQRLRTVCLFMLCA